MSLETDLQEGIRQHAASRELWQQQSVFHEKTRAELIDSVNEAIANVGKGIFGSGTKQTQLGIFGGTLQYQSGGVAGTDDFKIVTRDAGATGLANLHLNTGVQKTVSVSVMLLYDIRGYNYGSNIHNSERISAYLYYTGVYQQRATDNGMAPVFYVGSDNNFYLRLRIISQYYNQIVIDATGPMGIEKLGFIGGRITAIGVDTL